MGGGCGKKRCYIFPLGSILKEMKTAHPFSIDFIFLYICIAIIAWMGASYYIEARTDSSYAETKRVRVGYEVRDYTEGKFVGREVLMESILDLWMSAKALKTELRDLGVEILDYPFFVRRNADGKSFVYAKAKAGAVVDVEGFDIVNLSQDTAYLEFRWYPTSRKFDAAHADINRSLVNEGVLYNTSEVWMEVRSPWYVIPFMAHNGVFMPIE